MINDEKAKEIARKWYYDEAPNTVYCAAYQMAQWKDEQALRAFCRLTCPDFSCLDNNEKPCESYKLFEKILKGE